MNWSKDLFRCHLYAIWYWDSGKIILYCTRFLPSWCNVLLKHNWRRLEPSFGFLRRKFLLPKVTNYKYKLFISDYAYLQLFCLLILWGSGLGRISFSYCTKYVCMPLQNRENIWIISQWSSFLLLGWHFFRAYYL